MNSPHEVIRILTQRPDHTWEVPKHMLERAGVLKTLTAASPDSNIVHRPETKTVDFQIVVTWLYTGHVDLSPVLCRNLDKVWRVGNVLILVRKLGLNGMYMPVARSLVGFAMPHHEAEFLAAVELVHARNAATPEFRQLFREKCGEFFSSPATEPSAKVLKLVEKDGPLAVDIFRCRLAARSTTVVQMQQRSNAVEAQHQSEIQGLRQTVHRLENRISELQQAQASRAAQPCPAAAGPGDWPRNVPTGAGPSNWCPPAPTAPGPANWPQPAPIAPGPENWPLPPPTAPGPSIWTQAAPTTQGRSNWPQPTPKTQGPSNWPQPRSTAPGLGNWPQLAPIAPGLSNWPQAAPTTPGPSNLPPPVPTAAAPSTWRQLGSWEHWAYSRPEISSLWTAELTRRPKAMEDF